MNSNYEFRRAYAKGASASTARIVVYCRKRRGNENRIGITVNKKIGGAVLRNKVRRRLREIYRLSEGALDPGYDIVIVARGRSVFSTYTELNADFLYLAKKLGLLAGGHEQ